MMSAVYGGSPPPVKPPGRETRIIRGARRSMLIPVVACAILFVTYVVIAIGRAPFLRVDRTGAAIVGATLMIATGVISLDQAYAAIDFRTLILLFGMMVLIAHLRMAGFFRLVVRAVAQRVHEPRLLLVAVVFVSGILSALFVNDTICLIFTPIVIEIALARGHRPLPYLLALATASTSAASRPSPAIRRTC